MLATRTSEYSDSHLGERHALFGELPTRDRGLALSDHRGECPEVKGSPESRGHVARHLRKHLIQYAQRLSARQFGQQLFAYATPEVVNHLIGVSGLRRLASSLD
ncbi:hypothetical protein [Streptomyces sp. NPDC059761]|uniref:hypothetical protein n=1 Tax=Streptomyces sp. NPDC059761 TaxID=3346937 RepID=UPI00365F00CC